MINRLSIVIILVLQTLITFSQNSSVGSWRDHLPYVDAVSVAETKELVYCATNSTLFTYDKTDFSLGRLSIVNELSDIGISKVGFNEFNQKTVVAYVNGNIDIIDANKSISNLPAIKTAGIAASKQINDIYFVNELAYLSTGFGIVVLNTEKLEIVETYFFGPLGSSVYTNAVTSDGANLYAATEQGVFFASLNSVNLIDFNAWSLLPDLQVGEYSNIASFSGMLFVSLELPSLGADTVYYNSGGVWSKFIQDGLNVSSLDVSRNTLLISAEQAVSKYDETLTKIAEITHYNNSTQVSPSESVMDASGYVLIADKRQGLIRIKNNFDGEVIHPNGPSSANVFKMDLVDQDLWTVSGGYSFGTFEPSGVGEYIYNHKADDVWKDSREYVGGLNGSRVGDAVSVAINPTNPSEVYIGSWMEACFRLLMVKFLRFLQQ